MSEGLVSEFGHFHYVDFPTLHHSARLLNFQFSMFRSSFARFYKALATKRMFNDLRRYYIHKHLSVVLATLESERSYHDVALVKLECRQVT